MAKGLDNKFLHYGIRKEDLDLIETLCEKHNVSFDWFCEEILRNSNHRLLVILTPMLRHVDLNKLLMKLWHVNVAVTYHFIVNIVIVVSVATSSTLSARL